MVHHSGKQLHTRVAILLRRRRRLDPALILIAARRLTKRTLMRLRTKTLRATKVALTALFLTLLGSTSLSMVWRMAIVGDNWSAVLNSAVVYLYGPGTAHDTDLSSARPTDA